jgi:hypothetical protein
LSGVFLLESKNLEQHFKTILKDSLTIIFQEPNREIQQAIFDWILKGVKEKFPQMVKQR